MSIRFQLQSTIDSLKFPVLKLVDAAVPLVAADVLHLYPEDFADLARHWHSDQLYWGRVRLAPLPTDPSVIL